MHAVSTYLLVPWIISDSVLNEFAKTSKIHGLRQRLRIIYGRMWKRRHLAGIQSADADVKLHPRQCHGARVADEMDHAEVGQHPEQRFHGVHRRPDCLRGTQQPTGATRPQQGNAPIFYLYSQLYCTKFPSKICRINAIRYASKLR